MDTITFAALAGIVADIDPTAVVQTCPQRSEAAAHDLADQMPHSLHIALDDQDRRAALPAKITDRLGANWGCVPAVVIARTPRGDNFAFIGDIIGVDTFTLQFANDRRIPLGRVVAVGME
ncbi:hypothetical protein AB0331_13810 [Dietzia maris]|uniref:hypothetical protein n=1 Tax=Dietzia maris TaxID=37915 RepID=UPI00344D59E5